MGADKQKEQKRHDRAMKNPAEVTTTEIPDHVTPDGVKLPGWWQVQKDGEGRTYYINNFKKETTWDPPTERQIEEEREEMQAELPPPSYDPETKSKKKFEEVNRRSLVKRRSLIDIKSGKTDGLTEEQLLDVKREDRPTAMTSAPYSGDKKHRKRKKKEREARRAEEARKAKLQEQEEVVN